MSVSLPPIPGIHQLDGFVQTLNVQCRYGTRVIAADGTNNAVFVSSLKDVGAVLDVFLSAASAGELDAAIAKTAERKPCIKPGVAKAAQNG